MAGPIPTHGSFPAGPEPLGARNDLLEKTSRTFALSIPRASRADAARGHDRVPALPDRRHLRGRGALDAGGAHRRRSPTSTGSCRDYDRPRAERLAKDWVAREVAHHAGYRELMARDALRPRRLLRALARQRSRRSASTSSAPPRAWPRSSPARGAGSSTLHSVKELQDYCYIVAGIVGEMLSELFLLDRPALSGIAPYLRERAATFGEALQLVNILKDSATDAEEGRRYLPAERPRSRRSSPSRAATSVSPASTSARCRRPTRRAASSSSRRSPSSSPGPRSSGSRSAARARRSRGPRSSSSPSASSGRSIAGSRPSRAELRAGATRRTGRCARPSIRR